jgi:hypothetical protein
MENSWIYHVRNEEVLLRVKEYRNMVHEINKRKVNWIGHILCRNCLYDRLLKEDKMRDRSDRETRKKTMVGTGLT